MFEHFDLRVVLVAHIEGLGGFEVVALGAEVPPGPVRGMRPVAVDYGATEYAYSYPLTSQAPANSGCVIMLRADAIGDEGTPDPQEAVASARLVATSIQKLNTERATPGFKHIVVGSTETAFVGDSSASDAELYHIIRVESRKLTGV